MPHTIKLNILQNGETIDLTQEEIRVVNAVSPTVEAERTDNGVEITVHDIHGTETVELYDGEDGVSPSVSVSSISGGHRVSVTDADGTETFDVMDGEDGRTPEIFTAATTLPPGSSAYAHVSGTVEQPLITFGIPRGETGAAGSDGKDGEDGLDGVSPEITVTDITGGHRVTITDKDHPSGQTFDVMNGEPGTTDYNDLTNKPNLSAVAISGSYADLTNKPTIPAAQVNSDWDAASGVSQILNKPTIPSAHETWTFTLSDNTTVTKDVVLWQ